MFFAVNKVNATDGERIAGDAIDCIKALRRGNRLDGLNIKDLIHEGHQH
jgi:hypothetical protein